MGHYFKRGFCQFQRIYYYKKNENKVVIANVEKVNKETALPNFNSGIVVVDDINIQKNYSITLSVKEKLEVSYSLMIRIFVPK